MSSYLKRLTEYYESAGIDHLVLGGALWRVYQRTIRPVGPVCMNYTISPEQQQQLLDHFRHAVLVQYTDGFPAGADPLNAPDAPWYAVACNRFVAFDDFNSHFRNKLRKGMKLCDVHRVDAAYIAERGYDCFMAAFVRYRHAKLPNVSRADYARNILQTAEYPDLWDYWAVSVDNELAGYAANLVFDTIEGNYTTLKLDPRFLKAYSSYALHFSMNEFYLQQRGVSWVVNGFRSIAHDTHIQDLLVDYFGFRCVPTNLRVRYRPWVKAALCLPRFARRLAGRILPSYAALCTLDEARCRDANP
jgi:hypothetical protein